MCPASVPQLAVRVPASTSNLGPGFDFLGLALSLYVEAQVLGAAAGEHHELVAADGEASNWPQEPGADLLGRAIDVATEAAGARREAVLLAVHSDVPLGRGFGSSGAAVAAGLLLGNALAGDKLTRAELVTLGCELEGHPDNSTASLLAGCTLAVPHSGGLRIVMQDVSPLIGFAAAWPQVPLTTQAARAALPTEVPFADAVENPRRLALLLEGLRTGDPELLALGAEERLHERFRLPLIAGGEAALNAAREAGAWMACISGSGSGLVALASHDSAGPVAEAMGRSLDDVGGPAVSRVVDFVNAAPVVTGF